MVGGGAIKQCVLSAGTCECRPAWANQNLTTQCDISNEFGTCVGSKTCGVDGLTACTGQTPAAEVCDGVDQDCDDLVDNIEAADCERVNAFGTCIGQTRCELGEQVCEGPDAIAEVCNGMDDDCDGTLDEDTCDDGLSCTTDVCEGGETCSNTIDGGFCVIDGACVAENTPNPSFPCQLCVPAVSTTNWTGGDGTGGECYIAGQCYPEGAAAPGRAVLALSARGGHDHLDAGDRCGDRLRRWFGLHSK